MEFYSGNKTSGLLYRGWLCVPFFCPRGKDSGTTEERQLKAGKGDKKKPSNFNKIEGNFLI